MNRVFFTLFGTIVVLAVVATVPNSSIKQAATVATPESVKFVKELFNNITPTAACTNLVDCVSCCNSANVEYAACRTQKTGGSVCECIIRAWRFCGIDCGAGPCSCCDSWERAWNTQRCDGT